MNYSLFIFSIFMGYVNTLVFYPFNIKFNPLNNNNLIYPLNTDNVICNDDFLDNSIRGGLKYNHIINTDNIKYSIIGLDEDLNHIKGELGKKFVISLSSLLPKVDTIGHDWLQTNNRFIVDVLSYQNIPDDVKKKIILLSIKLAQYGDDLGSVFLQQYYDLVDKFL